MSFAVELNRSIERLRIISQKHPNVILASKFLILAAVFSFVSWRKLDPDFGWHLAAGNYIRAHGIPAHDLFTYTAPNFPWIDHEWGNDVFTSILYSIGSYGLAAIFYGILWAAALVISAPKARLSVLLLAALALILYVGVRPEAWTVLFLAITIRILEGKREQLTWLLPILFIFWANLHAGFIVGLAMIIFVGIVKRKPKLFIVALLSALATIINAYGFRLYSEVFRTLFDSSLHSQVDEWAPFRFNAAGMLFIVLWAVGFMLFDRKKLRAWLRPSTPLLLSAISATRNVPLFVTNATSELDSYVTRFRKEIRIEVKNIPLASRFFVALEILIAVFVVIFCIFRTLNPLKVSADSQYPAEAVAYLKAHGCKGGNIFNDYQFGGYLIWKLPGQKVYIDGRMPSWKNSSGEKYVSKYISLFNRPDSYKNEFATYSVRCSLLQNGKFEYNLISQLNRDGWRTAIATKYYVLQISPE
jgi:hypothetical protein